MTTWFGRGSYNIGQCYKGCNTGRSAAHTTVVVIDVRGIVAPDGVCFDIGVIGTILYGRGSVVINKLIAYIGSASSRNTGSINGYGSIVRVVANGATKLRYGSYGNINTIGFFNSDCFIGKAQSGRGNPNVVVFCF